MATYLSLVIPVLNEAAMIQSRLLQLQALRERGHEIILVDGGSNDQTPTRVTGLADKMLLSPAGRALQMNRGAAAATGDILLFLHADTELPPHCDRLIKEALTDEAGWGRFDVQLSGDRFIFRIISFCINLRSRISGIATGDQAIFISRDLFDRAGGYPPIALMEDIALSRRLRKYRRPHCLSARAITSSRRWEQRGIIKTVLLMWWLRLKYFLGADPDRLAKSYYSSN